MGEVAFCIAAPSIIPMNKIRANLIFNTLAQASSSCLSSSKSHGFNGWAEYSAHPFSLTDHLKGFSQADFHDSNLPTQACFFYAQLGVKLLPESVKFIHSFYAQEVSSNLLKGVDIQAASLKDIPISESAQNQVLQYFEQHKDDQLGMLWSRFQLGNLLNLQCAYIEDNALQIKSTSQARDQNFSEELAEFISAVSDCRTFSELSELLNDVLKLEEIYARFFNPYSIHLRNYFGVLCPVDLKDSDRLDRISIISNISRNLRQLKHRWIHQNQVDLSEQLATTPRVIHGIRQSLLNTHS